MGTDTTPGGHHYAVRYLERLPPGTPYPAIAERIREILDRLRVRTEEAPHLYVDATGRSRACILTIVILVKTTLAPQFGQPAA